ncbi:helix-turn-helix domain-containing protein [Nocardiopsis sp. HNM0947]|uniref:Helix-turn-helix domain-containing protein n=1 Tax=Nocardiopsis coralli TaxID=2772213 RepID=A0ABR9PA16_9ACTN|nr:helix-turn-helix domain-containing protein [Nocardiopsis coralli]MBE3000691.1 helix-turn-helix domain-containing protein [Nocardiopsis coralli]
MERNRIAAGLHTRQGYAAIARELGRPTSTVSREVARNGGREGYGPERAQEATHRRARRGRSSFPQGPDAAPKPAETDPERVRDFAEDFAGAIMLAGTPRMPARVLAHLLVADTGALSAYELCARLEVSPGAISKAVRFLEVFSLVRRERPAGRRRELYRFSGDWVETFARREELFAPWEHGARRGAHLLGAHTPAGARMAELAHFMRVVRGTIVQVRERWRRAAQPEDQQNRSAAGPRGGGSPTHTGGCGSRERS